jgi:hypothetical protein
MIRPPGTKSGCPPVPSAFFAVPTKQVGAFGVDWIRGQLGVIIATNVSAED